MDELLNPLINHVWQSTVFAALVALAVLTLRNNQAKTRYWLWLAASIKFLIPFSVLVVLGSRFDSPISASAVPTFNFEQTVIPFTSIYIAPFLAAPEAAPWWPAALAILWLAGSVAILARWYLRWLAIGRVLRSATVFPSSAPILIQSAKTAIEPGVFGVLRPVLLLPEGITDKLGTAELAAIVAHELIHVKRQDNLTAAIHMFVEATFWFHPLVWWIGVKMIEERERACDEAVLEAGNQPHIYAQGILNVCKFYLESPLPCASGVTGADLKKRIEEIMNHRIAKRLTRVRKLLLVTAGMLAVAVPIYIGMLQAPQLNAQNKPETLAFEVASIKPSDPASDRVMIQFVPGGGLNATNMGVKQLIAMAYNVPCRSNCDSLITGGPAGMDSWRFDINAKGSVGKAAVDGPGPLSPERNAIMQSEMRMRVRALLAERFQLAIRHESKEVPIYALTVAKGGPKLKEASGEGERMVRVSRGRFTAQDATIELLITDLAGVLGRPVVDRTGLKGAYEMKLEYAPEAGPTPAGPGGAPEATSAEASAPSIFAALQEQLGLKLEAGKGPVQIIAIDRVTKPSEN